MQSPLPSRANSEFRPSTTQHKRQVRIQKSEANTAVSVIEVRNLDDQNWLEHLELEVKNISRKSIYYLEVLIIFPDAQLTEIDGVPRTLVIPLMYGRYDLTKEGYFAASGEASIKAGDSHVFTIPESDVRVLSIV